MNKILLIAMLIWPVACGLFVGLFRFKNRGGLKATVITALAVEAVMTVVLVTTGMEKFTLFSMTDKLYVSFAIDGVAGLFALVAAIGWLVVGIYSVVYTNHLKNENVFYAFYLIVLAAIIGMDFSSNLISMYFFFEMITLSSMPLVLHERTKESIRAALKYLYYSIAGAFLGLSGIFVMYNFCDTLEFVPGGSLSPDVSSGLLLTFVFLCCVGFGAKAGMYPLHGWLPTAHPVAPAPASAVLSGIIAKAGVLAILRIIYYVIGPAFLRGTWAQYALIGLSLCTVFVGSMMALREDLFKKRLAYSTVSQVSYILTGLFFMTVDSFSGAILHVLFHASVKVCLFMVAGSVIYNTGKTRVSELRGIGKQMPFTMLSFTFAALSLIGIPPFGGFISKWYLAAGSLNSELGFLTWFAPAILLISALLTAAYLLPITVSGFFPGEGSTPLKRTNEGGVMMWAPIAILGVYALASGLFSSGLVSFAEKLATTVLGA